jgi:hypothetical protein
MLVDLRLNSEDAFMVQRTPDGRTVLSIPLDVLMRAFTAFHANRAQFEQAAQQETRQ